MSQINDTTVTANVSGTNLSTQVILENWKFRQSAFPFPGIGFWNAKSFQNIYKSAPFRKSNQLILEEWKESSAKCLSVSVYWFWIPNSSKNLHNYVTFTRPVIWDNWKFLKMLFRFRLLVFERSNSSKNCIKAPILEELTTTINTSRKNIMTQILDTFLTAPV